MGLLDKVFDRDENEGRKDARAGEPNPADAPRADFSQVQGASDTTAPASSPSAGARTYTVRPGDSLSKIARDQLGDASRWPSIFEANRDKISNPDLIHPGQVLTLPNT